jgi:hypothetical protein
MRMTNDLTNDEFFMNKIYTCCNGGLRQDESRMPVYAIMTTNGSATLPNQYNEFAIGVQPSAGVDPSTKRHETCRNRASHGEKCKFF